MFFWPLLSNSLSVFPFFLADTLATFEECYSGVLWKSFNLGFSAVFLMVQFSSVQSLSCVRLFATPWIAAHQASLSITNSWSSLRLTSIESGRHPAISSSVVPFFFCPQSLPASESFPMSQLFPCGGQSTGVSALASFLPKKSEGCCPLEWTDLDLLAFQGTLKSLLQHHSSKASILRHSAFFTVQLSHPYMTIGKNRSLD